MNAFYHLLGEASAEGVQLEELYELCRSIKMRGMLIGGVAADSISHGEAWSFFQLGRLLERADKTSRILDVKYFLLLPSLDCVGTPWDDIQWSALLRSTSALETYRSTFGRITPENVVRLLLLDRTFPRSVGFCLTEAEKCLRAISGTVAMDYTNAAEQRLGQLLSGLRYTSVKDVKALGLHEYIDRLQQRMNDVDQAVYEVFFARPAVEGVSMKVAAI